jgi:hypothetical protein
MCRLKGRQTNSGNFGGAWGRRIRISKNAAVKSYCNDENVK